jgi:glycosyltransferase involved in cell wall biosynthesis
MRVLFVHNNFPAQYRHLAQRLAREPGFELAAIGSPTARSLPGMRLLRYPGIDPVASYSHPFARRFEIECRRCEQVLYGLATLRASGFEPDVIMAHPGWGETLPLRTFYPKARILLYCEFFYGAEGRDVGFDPEFPMSGIDFDVGLHMKNAATMLALAECDAGIAPTAWQRSTFPAGFRDKIRICHEGIDVDRVRPDPDVVLQIPDGPRLTRANEVVTFVARNLEPLRGYHRFMRALPDILSRRPNAHVVIVGGDGVSYGPGAPSGKTWRSIYHAEVADRIDQSRVHFMGSLPYDAYLRVLQVSSAHVYLTYPFVLSWSLLEAMSAGAVVVGSDTAPVREIIDGENGLLVPFFDQQALVDSVVDALARPQAYRPMRQRARQTVQARFDMQRHCLPAMLDILQETANRSGRQTLNPSPPVRVGDVPSDSVARRIHRPGGALSLAL